MSKIDLHRERIDRVRSFIKEHRDASFQAVADHFGTTPKRIMKMLAPGKTHGLPKCEALFCGRDGTHGFGAFHKSKNRSETRGTYFCFEHKDQGHD